MPPEFCTKHSESLKALHPDAPDLLPPWSRDPLEMLRDDKMRGGFLSSPA